MGSAPPAARSLLWCAPCLLCDPQCLHEILGDPFPGATKRLLLSYEFKRKYGVVVGQERQNHLMNPMRISSPVIMPRFALMSATFHHARHETVNPFDVRITATTVPHMSDACTTHRPGPLSWLVLAAL